MNFNVCFDPGIVKISTVQNVFVCDGFTITNENIL
jgi:hypothetical protein